MTARTSRYRLLVAGRLPTTVTELLADRFGPAAVVVAGARRMVVDVDADQAALRALLTLLWDVGQDIESVSRCGDRPDGAVDCSALHPPLLRDHTDRPSTPAGGTP